ncbi:MAG: hypothetical protein ACFFED_17755 [Candidatus Thorarchaeota archaeon]
MKAKLPAECPSDLQVACGKRGCIIFYKGEHCIFCSPADEILRDVLKQFGVSEDMIHEVDFGIDDTSAADEGIVALPTIEICNECIVGLPREGSVRDAIVKAIMHDCFCE